MGNEKEIERKWQKKDNDGFKIFQKAD